MHIKLDWMMEILSDLEEFCVQNKLPQTSEQLVATSQLLKDELRKRSLSGEDVTIDAQRTSERLMPENRSELS